MLTDAQQAQLESIVQGVSPDLQVEEARLDDQQSLEVVLCREFICFRPLQISTADVDIIAALDGQSKAQDALQAYLRTALQGML